MRERRRLSASSASICRDCKIPMAAAWQSAGDQLCSDMGVTFLWDQSHGAVSLVSFLSIEPDLLAITNFEDDQEQ